MPSFFSDDDRCGNDLNDTMKGAPDAIKLGWALGKIFGLPFVILGKIVEAGARASQAKAQARQERTAPPPPRPEPPPFSRQQSSQRPPPPPPPKPDPLDKYRHILGVSATADKEEIKKRYRFLSHLCHPDKVAEHLKEQAGEEFKKISEAYQVLYAVAPEAPTRPRSQQKKTETHRPTPKPQEPKRETERPKQSKTEPPKPKPQAQSKAKEEKPAAETPKMNGGREWLKSKRPSDFNRPKYW
jgi:outer membrane biosynthesis protein TonB